jgi:hypothetical protein
LRWADHNLILAFAEVIALLDNKWEEYDLDYCTTGFEFVVRRCLA